MKKTNKYSWSKNAIALGLIAVGFLFIFVSGIGSFLSYLRGMTITVTSPEKYSFINYNNLLKDCAKDELFDYKTALKSKELSLALSDLERTSPNKLVSNQDKLAFWINAYNLLSIKNIVDHYPISSLEKLGQANKQKQFIVGGKTYTLAEIKHDELDKLIKELNPSTVFLVCPGALGYPSLPNHALETNTLDKDAEEATGKFALSDKSHVWIKEGRSFKISRFFLWNENILKKKYSSGFALVNNYLPENEKIDFHDRHIKFGYLPDFDLRLNDYIHPIK